MGKPKFAALAASMVLSGTFLVYAAYKNIDPQEWLVKQIRLNQTDTSGAGSANPAEEPVDTAPASFNGFSKGTVFA